MSERFTEAHVGRAVVYRPTHGSVEQGVITSMNDHFVFVRYGADTHAKATEPALLQFLTDDQPTQGAPSCQ